MATITKDELIEHIRVEGRRLGAAARANPDAILVSCPDWRARDLLAHVCGFARYVLGVLDGTVTPTDEVPAVDPEAALHAWDDDVAALAAALLETPSDAPVWNWSAAPDTAAFWTRRAAHELAVHRWDAETTGSPSPIAVDLARDGIAEFFEVFVATGLAAGLVPPAAATLVLEPTDPDERIELHLPDPGPETVLQGTSSDLLLALWHRCHPVTLYVRGDRALLERWPHI